MRFSNELKHYGIPGMKWGVRRFQNSDGTLTTAGKARYGKNKVTRDKLINELNEGISRIDMRKIDKGHASRRYPDLPMVDMSDYSGNHGYKALKELPSVKALIKSAKSSIDSGEYETGMRLANRVLEDLGNVPVAATRDPKYSYDGFVTYSQLLQNVFNDVDDYYETKPARDLKKNSTNESDRRLADVPPGELQNQIEEEFGDFYTGKGKSALFNKINDEYSASRDKLQKQMENAEKKYDEKHPETHSDDPDVWLSALDAKLKDPEFVSLRKKVDQDYDKYMNKLVEGALKTLGYDATPEAIKYIRETQIMGWD